LQRNMSVYVMAIWSILRPFVIFSGSLVYFNVILYISSRFWYVLPRKIWQPWHRSDFLFIYSILWCDAFWSASNFPTVKMSTLELET
jgi:hypothetical protein